MIELSHDPGTSWLKLVVKRLLGAISCEFYRNYIECGMNGITIPSLLPTALESSSCWISRDTWEKRGQDQCQITTLVLQDLLHCSRIAKKHEGDSEKKMLLYLLYSEHQRDEWIEWVNQSREMENILLLLTDYFWKRTGFRNWFGKHLVWLCYSIALYFCININKSQTENVRTPFL